jgi:hypothetical protein
MAEDHHVLGISGGKDSAALAIYMRNLHPEIDITYFFTDTGEELPETYAFIAKLEKYLGKPIKNINPDKDFKFWLKTFNYYLPSAHARWCTRLLKIKPFERWIKPWLDAGDNVISYVGLRADEEHRKGYTKHKRGLSVRYPLRDAGIDRQGVVDLLEATVGYPAYYSWRSRSGCTFCFFQQKIEWVNLLERYPDLYEAAKTLEKTAIDHASPFMFSKGESLSDLAKPERVIKIKADYARRVLLKNESKPVQLMLGLDDVYGCDEGNGACNICHK